MACAVLAATLVLPACGSGGGTNAALPGNTVQQQDSQPAGASQTGSAAAQPETGGAAATTTQAAQPEAAAKPAAQAGSSTSTTDNATKQTSAQPPAAAVKAAGPAGAGAAPAVAKATGKAPAKKAAPAAEGAGGAPKAKKEQPCVPATGSPVNIGNVGDYSGALADDFGPGADTIRVWAKATNACGGLNGHQINLFVADDQSDPALALSQTKTMVEQNHVIAFVGDYIFLTYGAVLPYLQKVNIPLIGGDGYNDLWFSNPMAFPLEAGPNVGFYQSAMKLIPKPPEVTKGGGIYCNEEPICQTSDNAAARAYKEKGIQLVLQQPVSLSQPSYTAQCQALKEAGAQWIDHQLTPAADIRFIKDCNRIGYHPHDFTIALGASKLQEGDPLFDGLIVGQGVFPWPDESIPATKAAHDAVRKYDPGLTLGGAFSLSWASGELLRAASSFLTDAPTTAQLFQGLYSLKGETLNGLTGPLSFAQGAHLETTFAPCVFEVEIVHEKWSAPQGAKCV
jgi:branched-chain amino acid transport system substrate-binding protein